MTFADLVAIAQTLNQLGIHYLTVGGAAVVAHGYVRSTIDLDLLLQMDDVNIFRALDAFRRLHYESRTGSSLEDFFNAGRRRALALAGTHVFRLCSPWHDWTGIDLLTGDSLDFEMAYLRRIDFKLAGQTLAVCAYDDLVKLKRLGNRTQDILDVLQLEKARSTPTEAELSDPWFTATFEGCEMSHLHESAAWSFEKKIIQLEEFHKLARVFQEARRKMGSTVRAVRASGLIEDA